MPGIHIVTDSSCDLTSDDLDQLEVEVVPLSIRFGSEEFTDGLDLTVAEFYSRMAETDELPQTSCPSPGAFEQAFRRASDAGADSVVCLNISGGLSNTLQSAKSASDAVAGQIPVHVIDSRVRIERTWNPRTGGGPNRPRRSLCRGRLGADPIAHFQDPRVRCLEHAGKPEEGRPDWRGEGDARVHACRSNRSLTSAPAKSRRLANLGPERRQCKCSTNE